MHERSPTPNILGLQVVCVFLGIIGFVAYAVSKFTSGRAIVLITVIGLLGSLVAFIILARQLKSMGHIVKAIVISLLAVVLGSYIVLFALIYFFQDAIANKTSAFFQPRSISAEAAQALVASDVEAIHLTTPDGARLSGWLVRNSTQAQSPLVIYFDGSGSESSKMIPYARKLDGWSVALIRYRGFGPSTGTPSQANAFADATLIYDTLSKRPDINSRHIVSMGYSLGTGIAVYLSEQRPVAGTILVSPYGSMTLAGPKQPPIYAPLSGIMHRYFDSISRVPTINSPMLCLIGSNDWAVPPELSLKLAGKWGGQTTIKTYAGEDHSLFLHDNGSWTDILAFLQGIEQK